MATRTYRSCPVILRLTINDGAKKELFSLEAKKLFRCPQVLTCASVVDATGGATRTIVVEIATIGVECWIRYIECFAHYCGNGSQ